MNKFAVNELRTSRFDPALNDDAIHLWVAPESPSPALGAATACRDLMTDAERRRESGFRHERDRSLYRLARALTRMVLSRYADIEPCDWVFERGPTGRPKIVSPPGLDLEFSLSHTPGMVLLLVGRGRAIGVDVEDARRAVEVEAAASLLGPLEIADLRSRSGARQRRRFLEYWTLKESYAKARATGLSLPLDRCEFQIEPGRVRATIDAVLDPDPERWWFSLPATAPGFVAAVTASRRAPGTTAPRLAIFPASPPGS